MCFEQQENIKLSINTFPRAGCAGTCLDVQSSEAEWLPEQPLTGDRAEGVCPKPHLQRCSLQLWGCPEGGREGFTSIYCLPFLPGLAGQGMWRFSLSSWMDALFLAILFTSIMNCNFVLKPKHCMETAVSRESRNAGCNNSHSC